MGKNGFGATAYTSENKSKLTTRSGSNVDVLNDEPQD